MSSNSKANLDVAALLDRSELDAVAYKTFGPAEGVSPKPPVEPPAGETAGTQPQDPVTAIESYARTLSKHGGGEHAVVMEAASQLLLDAIEGNSAVQREASWGELPVSRCMTMVGAVGGAGVTTILADLAAALAQCGERVVIADRGPSILPFHFGGRSFRSAPASFMTRGQSANGPIHLVTGAADAPSEDWLLHGVHEFQPDADRILVACRPEMSREARQWATKGPAVVLLLTPDPASLLRLPAALDQIRRSGEGEPRRAWLLLNRFDPSNHLHAESRAALSQRIGESLLPFVIRNDDAFARCLAAGGTASELMPESGAAEDIRALVEWLRNHGSTPEF